MQQTVQRGTELAKINFSFFVDFKISTAECQGVAGVVVSCKIPILATRVRFPGDAHLFFPLWLLSEISQTFAAELYNSARVA